MSASDSPARLPPPGDAETIYVLDVSGYVFRAYHALPPLSSAKGEPTHAVLGFTNMLLKLVDDLKPKRFCVCYDPRGPSFRKERYPEYKANRQKHPEDIYQQLQRCFEVVDAYEIPGFRHDSVEADDLIATVTKQSRAAGYKVVIVSADKDLLQLVADGVIMYDTMRDKVYGRAETVAKMGVPPEQVGDLLALVGDSSDNIPGVPSVGPKTAQKLLAEHKDLNGVYEALEGITKKALKAKLTEHRDDAFLSRELVALVDDVDIDIDFEALLWSGGDKEKLRALFVELEFTRLVDKLDPLPRMERKSATVETVDGEERLAEVVRELQQTEGVSIFAALEDDAPLTGFLVGVALASSTRVFYVPIGHHYLGAPAMIAEGRALELMKPLLENPAVRKRAPELKREALALRRRGIELEPYSFDTTVASYLLDAGKHNHRIEDVVRSELDVDLLVYDKVTDKQRGSQKPLSSIEVERVRDYACTRAELTEVLTEGLRARLDRAEFTALLEEVELPLTKVLVDLEATGVRIDTALLKTMSTEVSKQLKTLETKAHELAGKAFNVASPKQLEGVLFDDLGLKVVKKTKTGGRSTDSDVLEELGEDHELPGVVLEHRQLSKLKGTYLDALPKAINRDTGRVHTLYNQAVAATGRLSSSEPNLQNIPIRTEVGRRIREAFIAEDGWEIFSADYSQIELRVLAHLADDEELVDAFSKHEDVHVRTATALFEVGAEDVTREQRGQAKTVNYAVIYGQSHFALARNLGIERTEAMRYIEAFFDRYAGVKAFMEETIKEARRTGATRTLLGRRRDLPDLRSRNRMNQMAAERMARNTPIQGSAADIMKVAMVRIAEDTRERELRARMLLTVHDELVFEAPPEEKETLQRIVHEHMEHAAELKVPLVVDSGWGPTWGTAH